MIIYIIKNTFKIHTLRLRGVRAGYGSMASLLQDTLYIKSNYNTIKYLFNTYNHSLISSFTNSSKKSFRNTELLVTTGTVITFAQKHQR